MIPVSQVAELFDGTGPGEGRDLYVGGGGYPEQAPDAAERTVYYPGGSATLRELNQAIQTAGPMGMGQAGGYRKSRKNRKQKSRKSRRGSKVRRRRN